MVNEELMTLSDEELLKIIVEGTKAKKERGRRLEERAGESFGDFSQDDFEEIVNYREKRQDDYQLQIFMEAKIWLECNSFGDFYREISKSVIGQEPLKLVLSNVYNYLDSVVSGNPVCNNMLLSAPSGCGKTETYRALKEYFSRKIPHLDVYLVDTTIITENGFRGPDASVCLTPFFDKDIRRPYGIVFLDEFDKKMRPSYSSHGTDINAAVQADMLTMVEGGEITERGKTVNTNQLMFVGMGSFDWVRCENDSDSHPIGIGTEFREVEEIHYEPMSRADMIDAGASYELLGRFPYIINYEQLSPEAVEDVIDKVTEETRQEFDLDELVLGEDMVRVLRDSANSQYGCRLIKAKLKEAVLKEYTEALFAKPEDSTLSLDVEAPGKSTARWTKIPLPEVEEMDEEPEVSGENDLQSEEPATEACFIL